MTSLDTYERDLATLRHSFSADGARGTSLPPAFSPPPAVQAPEAEAVAASGRPRGALHVLAGGRGQ